MSRALMSFTTGVLGGISDIAADKKAKDDEYQKLVTNLEFRGKEKEQDAEFDLKQLNIDIKRRKEGLLGLGFTEPFLDAFGQFALQSDDNAATWLQMNQDRYGTPFWMTTPIKYHHDPSYIGKTVQDVQLDSSNKGSTFDNKKVVNNVKKQNNLTDNIADSQVSGTAVNGNPVSDKTGGYGSPIFSDSEFFFGKKQFRTGEPKVFIGENGLKVTAFKVEQTPGKGDYGSTYYVNTKNGHETLPNVYGNNNYFDITTNTGERLANAYFPTVKEQKPMSFHMSIGGDSYVLHGNQTTTTDGLTKQTIEYMPYALTSKYPNLVTSQYFASKPAIEGAPDVPGAGFMTEADTEYYSYNVGQLRNDLQAQNLNFTLNAFNEGKADEFKLAETISGEKEDRKLTILDRNRIKSENLAPASGFDFSKDQLNYNEFTESYALNLFGNTSEEKIKRNIFTNISDPILDGWQSRSINQNIINALGIDANSDEVTAPTLGSRIGLVVDQMTSNVRSYYSDLVKTLDDKQFQNFVDQAPRNTVEGKPLTKENIDKWALESLADITNFEDLISINNQINETRQADFDTSVSNAIGSIEGASGDVATGMDIIDGIILNSMAKDLDTDLLGVELLNAFGGNQSVTDLVNSNYVAGKIAQLDFDALPETSMVEKDQTQQAKVEQIEDIDVEDWLNQNSVDPIPTIPSEAAEWKQQNASDPNVLNFFGGQGSLFDENTGFQIFKSRNLPAGHVEPRPKGEGVKSKTPKNWDSLYGKTHNADGTPKIEEPKTEE